MIVWGSILGMDHVYRGFVESFSPGHKLLFNWSLYHYYNIWCNIAIIFFIRILSQYPSHYQIVWIDIEYIDVFSLVQYHNTTSLTISAWTVPVCFPADCVPASGCECRGQTCPGQQKTQVRHQLTPGRNCEFGEFISCWTWLLYLMFHCYKLLSFFVTYILICLPHVAIVVLHILLYIYILCWRVLCKLLLILFSLNFDSIPNWYFYVSQ